MKYAIALLVILLILWYLSFSATRLDRLHHRVETSWANLDSILQRRAALALEIGDRKSTRLNSSHSQQSRMPSSA